MLHWLLDHRELGHPFPVQRNQSEPCLAVTKVESDHCKVLWDAAGKGRRRSVEGISMDAAGWTCSTNDTGWGVLLLFIGWEAWHFCPASKSNAIELPPNDKAQLKIFRPHLNVLPVGGSCFHPARTYIKGQTTSSHLTKPHKETYV